MRPVLVLVIMTFVIAFNSHRVVLSFLKRSVTHMSVVTLFSLLRCYLTSYLGSKSYTLAPFEEQNNQKLIKQVKTLSVCLKCQVCHFCVK
jgi:hypothetical protein